MQVVNTYIVFYRGSAFPLYQCLRTAGDTEFIYFFQKFHMSGSGLDGLEVISKEKAEEMILKT